MNFTAKLRSVLAELNSHHGGAGFGAPFTLPKTLADFPISTSVTGQVFARGGMKLGLSTASHAAAALQIAFDELPPAGDTSLWYNLSVNGAVRRPDGLPFKRFFARLQPGVAQDANKKAVLVIDQDPASGSGDTVQEGPRLGNVSVTGKMQVECGYLTLAGTDVSGIASDEGAVAISGWDGAAYKRASIIALSSNVGSPNIFMVGGFDGGANARTFNITPSGSAHGATPSTLLVGGSDGANARALLVDSSGRQVVVGGAASGAAASGSPILIAGQDTTSTVRVLPVISGGSTASGLLLQVGGSDGTNAQSLKVDTSGRPNVVGAAADAAATAGNPVLVAGSFSSNVKTLICVASNSTTTIDGAAGNSRLSVHNQASTTIVTLWSAASVGIAGTSATFPIYGHRRVEIFGNTSAATTLTIQFSQDAATWYDATSGAALGQTPSVPANGNFSLSFDTGAPYCRVKSSAAATITALGGAKA